MIPSNLIYIVFQEVEYEGSCVQRCFTLPYDACAFAQMLNEDNHQSDVNYVTVAYELF